MNNLKFSFYVSHYRCLIFYFALLTIKCAPKLSYIELDVVPLQTNDLGNDVLKPVNIKILRDNLSTFLVKNRTCGYDFDETKCRNLNNVIVCGYNKNIGDFNDEKHITEMANGCRARGDRVECGYVIGPFKNPRRPPVNDIDSNDADKSQITNVQRRQTSTRTQKLVNGINKQDSTTRLHSDNILRIAYKHRVKKQVNTTPAVASLTWNGTLLRVSDLLRNLNAFRNIVNVSAEKLLELTETTTLKTVEELTSKSPVYSLSVNPKRSCVEKDDRIVCFLLREK